MNKFIFCVVFLSLLIPGLALGDNVSDLMGLGMPGHLAQKIDQIYVSKTATPTATATPTRTPTLTPTP